MKRARLIVVAGIVVGLAALAEMGKETSPPPPLQEERGESVQQNATITPLEAEVRGLVGVRGVGVVISTGGTVYMEIDVLEGYAAQPFAEALLEVAQRHGTVEDFSVVLNDGVSVPQSFLWRGGTWNGVALEQIATQISATETRRPISLPTRAVDYSVPPTAPVVSPYTCNGVDDLNCSDFNRQWGQAQAHMQMCGDEDQLDGDGDGRACEY